MTKYNKGARIMKSTYEQILHAINVRPFGVSEKDHKEHINDLIEKQRRETRREELSCGNCGDEHCNECTRF